jgi:uncharacterized protein YndB with AHSA1/START domain
VLRDRLTGIEPKGFWTKHIRITDEYETRLKDAAPYAPVQAIVVQTFTASPERVFDAWLDTAMIGKFMYGPHLRDEEVVRLTIDPQVGGRFSFVVRRQGQEIDHIGRYEVIDRPRKLQFTWSVAPNPEDASRVKIQIEPEGPGCVLTLIHDLAPGWEDYRDRTQQGWTTMLKALQSAVS